MLEPGAPGRLRGYMLISDTDGPWHRGAEAYRPGRAYSVRGAKAAGRLTPGIRLWTWEWALSHWREGLHLQPADVRLSDVRAEDARGVIAGRIWTRPRIRPELLRVYRANQERADSAAAVGLVNSLISAHYRNARVRRRKK